MKKLAGAIIALSVTGAILFLWARCSHQMEMEKQPAGLGPAAEVQPPTPESTPPQETSSRPPPSSEAPSIRIGARRAAAYKEGNYYLGFTPVKDLRFDKLIQAGAGKQFAFEVFDLLQDTAKPVDGGFHIDKAGEIFALAIARQLEAMGLVAALTLPSGLKGSTSPEFQFKASDYARRIWVMGKLKFLVEHARRDNVHETRAVLSCAIRFLGLAGENNDTSPLYQAELNDEEKTSGPGLEGAAERARKVAGAVLQRAVKKLFSDAKLEEALVKFISS